MARTPTIKLRPSDAHRWLVCRASPQYVLENAHRIPEETFEFTEEGVRAHEAAKQLLTGGKPVYDDADMKTHVQGYVEFVTKARGKDHDAVELIVESAVNVFFYPGKKGYVDAALIYQTKAGKVRRIHIVDLKYGRGVSVQAEQNPQLSSYAFGLIEDLKDVYDFSDPSMEVWITIWQPRVTGEPAERTWKIDFLELTNFCSNIGKTADAIRADPCNQPFAPSEDACQFCPAYSFCDARTRWLLGEVDVSDDNLLAPAVLDNDHPAPLKELMPAPESLTPQQLSRILKAKSLLTKWLKKVEDYVTATALQHGTKYEGFKVVASTPHRKWLDEAEAEKFLRAHLGLEIAAPRYLITPAKAEELLKAREKSVRPATLARLQEMITRPDGQPTLAPITDKRLEWHDVEVEAEFVDETLAKEDAALL